MVPLRGAGTDNRNVRGELQEWHGRHNGQQYRFVDLLHFQQQRWRWDNKATEDGSSVAIEEGGATPDEPAVATFAAAAELLADTVKVPSDTE